MDKDESCELFADLLAKAPKIEEVKLGRYSSGSRLVHTDIKYAKESEPGVIPDNKMGLIRVYKVKATYHLLPNGNNDYNRRRYWKDMGEICRRKITKLEAVQPVVVDQDRNIDYY